MADPNAANIPAMIRHIAAGNAAAAADVLAETCPESAKLCDLDATKAQRACRRARRDQPVAIDLLVRYAAAAAGLNAAGRAKPVEKPPRRFSVHIGKLQEEELERFMAGISPDPQVAPADEQAGYTPAEAAAEARRCMHCDCRKADNCKLRDYAEALGAKPARLKGRRREFIQHTEHPEVIFEPAKCIACGLCIRLTARENEEFGLALTGRGFHTQVAPPFDRPLSEALQKTARRCAEVCPTAALAIRES